MQRMYGYARVLSTGAPVANAIIRVTIAGTPTSAVIFANDNATPTLKSNPFATDADGFFFFYAPNGRYDISFSGGAPPIPAPYTWSDVTLGVGNAGVVGHTRATLPPSGAAANAGRLVRLTDSVRGLWMDTGTQWISVTGEVVNVKDFGAAGDNITDDTAALQSAIDAVSTRGGRVFFPEGDYRVTAELTINTLDGLMIEGLSHNATRLVAHTPSQNVFNIKTAEPVVIKHLTIKTAAALTKTAGAAIRVAGPDPVGVNLFSRIEDVRIADHYWGLEFVRAHAWTVNGCHLGENAVGILVRQIGGTDGGDPLIVGNVLTRTTALPGSAAILNLGAGGVKILANKVLGHDYGLLQAIPGSSDSSVLLVVGNSFEGQLQLNILFRQEPGATGRFYSVVIAGNEFGGGGAAGTGLISILAGSSADWINNVSITGNTCVLLPAQAGLSIDGGSDIHVSGNQFYGADTINPAATGIFIGALPTRVNVGLNSYSRVSTTVISLSSSATIQPNIRTAMVSWTPGTTPDDGVVATTVSLPGARAGETAVAAFSSLGNTNTLLTAYVQADDVVRVVLLNKNGGAVNYGSGTLEVKVFSAQ